MILNRNKERYNIRIIQQLTVKLGIVYSNSD